MILTDYLPDPFPLPECAECKTSFGNSKWLWENHMLTAHPSLTASLAQMRAQELFFLGCLLLVMREAR